LLQELAARVDLQSHEGKAKLLQDAKPLVKQVAAPLLSLLLRKRLAELAGITQQELDAQYQIKRRPADAARPRQPARRAKSSLVRELVDWLVFDPSLAQYTDRGALSGAAEQVGFDVDPGELRTLERLLEVLVVEPQVRNFAEYFRGTEHDAMLREAEANSLRLQELKLAPEDMQREFVDGWQNLLVRVKKDLDRKAHATRGVAQFPASPQSLTVTPAK
jgi:DNA primase